MFVKSNRLAGWGLALVAPGLVLVGTSPDQAQFFDQIRVQSVEAHSPSPDSGSPPDLYAALNVDGVRLETPYQHNVRSITPEWTLGKSVPATRFAAGGSSRSSSGPASASRSRGASQFGVPEFNPGNNTFVVP